MYTAPFCQLVHISPHPAFKMCYRYAVRHPRTGPRTAPATPPRAGMARSGGCAGRRPERPARAPQHASRSPRVARRGAYRRRVSAAGRTRAAAPQPPRPALSDCPTSQTTPENICHGFQRWSRIMQCLRQEKYHTWNYDRYVHPRINRLEIHSIPSMLMNLF